MGRARNAVEDLNGDPHEARRVGRLSHRLQGSASDTQPSVIQLEAWRGISTILSESSGPRGAHPRARFRALPAPEASLLLYLVEDTA